MSKEAGRIVDISMLRFNVADIQKEISTKYEALGKMVYESVKSGKSASAGFDEQIAEIDALFKKLEDVNEKLNALRHKAVCPRCGFLNDEKSLFCSRCGAKLSEHPSNAPSSSPEEENEESDSSI